MHRQQLFLLFVAIVSIALGKEPNRHKRTLPFRNWVNIVPAGSNAGVQPSPPSDINSQWTPPGRTNPAVLQKYLPPASSVLSNTQYPIYKIHKFNGFHIKPVLPQEIKRKVSSDEYGPNSVNTIKSLLETNLSTDQIKSLVDLASYKDGMRVIMKLINSGIIQQEKHPQAPQHAPVYESYENSSISPQFMLPQLRPQLIYGLPNPSPNQKFRPTLVVDGFKPIAKSSVSPQPSSTSYGFPDEFLQTLNKAKPPVKNILSLKYLPKLPSLPEAQLFEQQTIINPFEDQKRVIYNVKTVQHIPVTNKEEQTDSFGDNNPIVVAYKSPKIEIPSGSKYMESEYLPRKSY